MTWPEARALFPVLDRYAYLNAGTFGPLARTTLDAMAKLRAWEGVHGRAGRPYFDEMLERRERVRALVAEQILAPVDNVALTESTTQGVHIVVVGLGLGPGDEVVTTDAEHFGLTGPLLASGATLRVAKVRAALAADVYGLIERGSDAAHAADRDVGSVVARRQGIPLARAARRDPGAGARRRCAVASARSRSTQPAPTSTPSAARSGCAAPTPPAALYVRRSRVALTEARRIPERRDVRHRRRDLGAEGRRASVRHHLHSRRTRLPGSRPASRTCRLGGSSEPRELTERCRELLLDGGHDVVTEARQATLVSWRFDGDTRSRGRRLYERA